ncbi:hypothetical protein [Planctellipticum variicoloris]|jgi:hypothetical protein|uniref:hypothetical protein n=1 Tax=Planctellipticum variicoloris TaxID=3064265 RepID=UPI002BBDA454|nr:hypothetical protein SH412_002052 [Planctomycetaceae bacterium SH412]HTN01939.1 hypothetical protein [Planctomycetaceae bacterium]
MIRASFFAAGVFVALWGVSFLTIDKLVLNKVDDKNRDQGFRGMLASSQIVERESRPVIDPPEWMAFSLMSIGTVTMLYSAALPKRHD